MKNSLKRSFILMMFVVSVAHPQLMFAVKPGMTGNSAQFGFKLGGLMAFGGIEFLRTTVTEEESGTQLMYHSTPNYPYYYYQQEAYNNKYEQTLNVYVPFIGAKILLGGREGGKVGAYITGIIGKPFITGKSIDNGIESESIKKTFDGISAWMLMGGFGGEYFFSEDFSIGGEFGLRVLLTSYKEETNETLYNPQTNTYQSSPRKNSLDIGVGITYSTIVLNYYF